MDFHENACDSKAHDREPLVVDEGGASSANTVSAVSPTYASQQLFRGAKMVVIEHAGEAYRLLLTRNNRLILQK